MLVRPEMGVGVSQKRTGSVYVCRPLTSGVHSASSFTPARARVGPTKTTDSSTAACKIATRSSVKQHPRTQRTKRLNLTTQSMIWCDTDTVSTRLAAQKVETGSNFACCEAICATLLHLGTALLCAISNARRPHPLCIVTGIVGCKHDTSSSKEQTRHSVLFIPHRCPSLPLARGRLIETLDLESAKNELCRQSKNESEHISRIQKCVFTKFVQFAHPCEGKIGSQPGPAARAHLWTRARLSKEHTRILST